jgi:hypothetical protein
MESESVISNVRKISATQGGFTGKLDIADLFGSAKVIGDVNGDGIEDMAVGAIDDDDGGTDRGAVWILFLNEDRTVKGHQKISATEGNFSGTLDYFDRFGLDIAPIGDFNHDGVIDIAVGAFNDDDAGNNSGAVWLLFLNSNGTVKSHQKISGTQGNVTGIDTNHQFGAGVISLGDLDGDGVNDIAVGSPTYDDDGGLYRGSVFILFLNSNGKVKSQKIINDYRGGFTGDLDDGDRFGSALENLGDINGDGIVDIAVQALYDDDGAVDAGAIYVLFMNNDGTVKQTQKISSLSGGFNGTIGSGDLFGCSMASLGDIDGNGTNDLLTSTYLSDEGGEDIGKAWILYLNSDATVKDYDEINYQNPALTGLLAAGDNFGVKVSVFNELNQHGKKEIIIGARGDDDGYTNAGAVYILDLDAVIPEPEIISNVRKISQTQGGFTGQLHANDNFDGVEAIGDIDGDGVEDLAVGAPRSDDGGTDRGELWILFMKPDGTHKSHQKISDTFGNFTGTLKDEDVFGATTAPLGDLNKDGVNDIVTSAPYDDDATNGSGALWVLFLNNDGTVKAHQKISATQGGMSGVSVNDIFGWSVTPIGDFNNDGNTDIAVGSPTYDSDGGTYKGCVWILFLNENGTVKEQHKINDYHGGLGYMLNSGDKFGQAVENIGDIDGDGIIDLAVGAPFDDDGATDGGAVYILFMNADCTVKKSQKINSLYGNFTGAINYDDQFGSSISQLGDIDGDGIVDFTVNSKFSDEGGPDRGKVWIIYLNADGTVKKYDEISSLSAPMSGLIDDSDGFGYSTTSFSGYTSTGKKQLAIGVWGDDDGFTNAGAVYILDLGVTNFLFLSKSSATFTAVGGVDHVTISSDLTWTATSDQSWLTVNPASGTGNGQLTMTATQNTTSVARTATITVTAPGLAAKTVTVTQQTGQADYLTVSATKATVEFTAGSNASVDVSSNLAWTATSNQPWLTVSPASSTGNHELTFTAEENTVETSRSATVTVSAAGVASQLITVTQLGVSSFEVDSDTIYIAGSFGSKGTFLVKTNIDWDVATTQTWLKVSPKSGTGNKTVTVTSASANPSTSPRTGSVTVSADGFASLKVTVVQASGDTTLSVTNNIVNIGYAEGSSAWTGITSNTTWNASADQSWLTVTPQNGDGNRNLVFVASENPLTTLRTATVTVSAIGAPTQTITVIQAARPGITIETDTIYIGREEGSTVQLPVSANVSWRAVQDETWLSVDPGSGIGDAVLTFTATANPTVAERAAVVSISGINIGVTHVTVIQEAALPLLSIDGNEFIISKEGGSISDVSLASNMNWNASSDQLWLTVSPLTGFGNKTLTFTAGKNLLLEQRVAYVTVTGQGVEPVRVKVIQEAGDPYLTLPTDEIHLGYQQGSTATIGITSNASWTITPNETWLTANPASGSGDAIITFTAQANPSQMDRPGSATFTIVGGTSQTIMAIQLAKPVSTETFANGHSIQLYPNPVTDGFHLKGIEGKAEVTITDLSGRVCLKQSMVTDQVVPAGNLAKGVYMVRITDSEGTVEKKLIKE